MNGRTTNDYLGITVDVYGNTAIAGAFTHVYDSFGLDSKAQAGAVYIYTRDGTTWLQKEKVKEPAPLRLISNYFGQDVALLDENTKAIAALYSPYDGNQSNYAYQVGAAYVIYDHIRETSTLPLQMPEAGFTTKFEKINI